MSRETRRLALHEKLVELLGTRNVYFQPPASIHMNYPCFVYSYEDSNKFFANDKPYMINDRYTLTLITKDAYPTELLESIEAMDYCDFERQYSSDNLHHFSFRLFLREGALNV